MGVCCHMLFPSCLFDLPTPPTFSNLLANGLTVWSPATTNYFRRNNLLMLASSNGHNFKTRTSFFIKFSGNTVKLQIFVRYLFSYFRLETGPYVLIFVLSRVCEENDVEIQWLQSKKKFSYDIKFRTFSKVQNVRK